MYTRDLLFKTAKAFNSHYFTYIFFHSHNILTIVRKLNIYLEIEKFKRSRRH